MHPNYASTDTPLPSSEGLGMGEKNTHEKKNTTISLNAKTPRQKTPKEHDLIGSIIMESIKTEKNARHGFRSPETNSEIYR